MFQSLTAVEIRERYNAGERQFQYVQLRRADLRGINLSHADLSGADLSYANLRDANLDGANLSEACLNEADLSGVNLKGANLKDTYLIKAYLLKTNLQGANLSDAYLTGAYLTKVNLSEADLTGAYLKGAKLCATELRGAYYDQKTHFDVKFDPATAGMAKTYSHNISLEELKITVEELLKTFNHISQVSAHYLGKSMTIRYWESSRPDFDWLNQFEVNLSTQITCHEKLKESVSALQLKWSQQWIDTFIQSCSQLIQNFPDLLDQKQLIFASAPSNQTNDFLESLL